MEAELETQLEQLEVQTRELQSTLIKFEQENELLKSRLDSHQGEAYVTITTLQEEREELIRVKEECQQYIRQLEQKNDDLERQMRVTVTTLEDFETRMNLQIEKNALLENELDEKEKTVIMCQRLKDEVRDLRSEININQQKSVQHTAQAEPPADSPAGTPSKPPLQGDSASTPSVLQTSSSSTLGGRPSTFTPSTRITALNMVGDLLRKVGALESRLASCRSHVITKEANKSLDLSTPQTHRFRERERERRHTPSTATGGGRFNGEVSQPAGGQVATVTV